MKHFIKWQNTPERNETVHKKQNTAEKHETLKKGKTLHKRMKQFIERQNTPKKENTITQVMATFFTVLLSFTTTENV